MKYQNEKKKMKDLCSKWRKMRDQPKNEMKKEKDLWYTLPII